MKAKEPRHLDPWAFGAEDRAAQVLVEHREHEEIEVDSGLIVGSDRDRDDDATFGRD